MVRKKPVIKHTVKKVRILRKKAAVPVIAPEPIDLEQYEELPTHELHIEEIIEAPALEKPPTSWSRIRRWFS